MMESFPGEGKSEFLEFIENEYRAEIMSNVLADKFFVCFDFFKLASHLPILADAVLD